MSWLFNYLLPFCSNNLFSAPWQCSNSKGVWQKCNKLITIAWLHGQILCWFKIMMSKMMLWQTPGRGWAFVPIWLGNVCGLHFCLEKQAMWSNHQQQHQEISYICIQHFWSLYCTLQLFISVWAMAHLPPWAHPVATSSKRTLKSWEIEGPKCCSFWTRTWTQPHHITTRSGSPTSVQFCNIHGTVQMLWQMLHITLEVFACQCFWSWSCRTLTVWRSVSSMCWWYKLCLWLMVWGC